jgi:hypothetical protein
MSENVIIRVPIELDDEFFDDIICTMFEGGSNYWLGKIQVIHPDGEKPSGMPASEWIASAVNKDGMIKILPQEDTVTVILDKKRLVDGLEKWITRHPSSVSLINENEKNSIDAGNIDADDADAILQYAVFGELVFG